MNPMNGALYPSLTKTELKFNSIIMRYFILDSNNPYTPCIYMYSKLSIGNNILLPYDTGGGSYQDLHSNVFA